MIKQKSKQSNFELMRIISMFLIVLYHVIHHGNIIEHLSTPSSKIIFTILEALTIVGVNSFILLTGYFQSTKKLKWKKIFFLILELLFYKVFIYIVLVLFNIVPITKTYILDYLFPKELEYWFVTYYIILYLISNYLNIIINKISFKAYTILVIILTIIFSIIPTLSKGIIIHNTGFEFPQFIYLYFVGAYLKILSTKYNLNNKKTKYTSLTIYLLLSLLIVVIYYITKNINTNNIIINGIEKYSFNYSNPLVIIQTIAYFLFFNTIELQSIKINNFSKYLLGIYLIHDNSLIRQHLYFFKDKITTSTSIIYALTLTIIISLIIYITSYIINYLIHRIFNIFKKDNQST